MSKSTQNQFHEFVAWSRLQAIRGRGFQEGRERVLRESLRRQWGVRTDKEEYLRSINYFEEQTLQVAEAKKKNDPSKGFNNRLARRAKSRCIAVALSSYCRSLQSLQRVQKRRGPRGQLITFAAIIRYHDRLLKEARKEIDASKRVAVDEAVTDMTTIAPDMPEDLIEYITEAYEHLPWAEIRQADVTDRDITRQMRTDIIASQDYNDLHTLNWSQEPLPDDKLHSFRRLGRVHCNGHITRHQGFEEEPFQRTFVSNEWRVYLIFFAGIPLEQRPVPLWVMRAAKARAEMAWDHNHERSVVLPVEGTPVDGIYPPEQDHEDLEFTLDKLLHAENEYYHHRSTRLYHVEIQYSMAEHLQERDKRPEPLPDLAAVPEGKETSLMLYAGRRALEHAWESEL